MLTSGYATSTWKHGGEPLALLFSVYLDTVLGLGFRV